MESERFIQGEVINHFTCTEIQKGPDRLEVEDAIRDVKSRLDFVFAGTGWEDFQWNRASAEGLLTILWDVRDSVETINEWFKKVSTTGDYPDCPNGRKGGCGRNPIKTTTATGAKGILTD